MRKRIVGSTSNGVSAAEAPWLDVERLAEIEVTSEDALHPIEFALRLEGRGSWRAAEPGAQTLRLREMEDYTVQLEGVTTLELQITPNISGGTMRPSLARWTVA